MSMPTRLIFVATHKSQRRKAKELWDYFERIYQIVETPEPQLIASNAFLSEDRTEMASIQVILTQPL